MLLRSTVYPQPGTQVCGKASVPQEAVKTPVSGPPQVPPHAGGRCHLPSAAAPCLLQGQQAPPRTPEKDRTRQGRLQGNLSKLLYSMLYSSE